MENSKASEVFIKRKKRTVRVDRHIARLRERELLSHYLMTVWIIFMGHFFQSPLTNHFDLPCSQSIFGISQDPPFTFHFHALEKEMATHSSILAWRIPGMGAWWAAVYGVSQSWTRLMWLSSSSSSSSRILPCVYMYLSTKMDFTKKHLVEHPLT